MLNTNYQEKINRFGLTVKVSLRLLGLLWQIDKKLLLANAVTMLIPGLFPFVFGFAFKLLIDQIVITVTGGAANLNLISTILIVIFVIYMVQGLAFDLQGYFNRLLYSKVPIFQ